MASHGLTDVQRDAIGYLGGGVLAVCLIPQVAKVIMTRSARDISIIWSLLYSTGLALSLAYLILKDAPAAWIPLIFEIVGCLLVLMLKVFYEYTATGRQYSAAKQQQQHDDLSLPQHVNSYSPQQQFGRGSRHSLMDLGQAAAAAVGSSGDISWRGKSVLGHNQPDADPSRVPMVDCSVHSHCSSRHDSSRHGESPSPNSGDKGLSNLPQGGKHGGARDQQQLQQQQSALEVRCTGTSVGASSSSNSADGQGSAAAAETQKMGEQQQQQQQQEQQEALFDAGWALPPVMPLAHAHAATAASSAESGSNSTSHVPSSGPYQQQQHHPFRQ